MLNLDLEVCHRIIKPQFRLFIVTGKLQGLHDFSENELSFYVGRCCLYEAVKRAAGRAVSRGTEKSFLTSRTSCMVPIP